MRNKGIVIFLTIIITLLCVYYLSFTLVSRSIRQDATAFATDVNGTIDFDKRQSYLDSVWNKPVYNLFGIEFTYKEIKETELNLGLDLQGGMHVTLEVSQPDIIAELSNDPKNPAFVRAMERAKDLQKSSTEPYVELFFQAYREQNPSGSLTELFVGPKTRGDIEIDDTNDEIISTVKDKIDEAIESSFTIIRTRVDKFGTSQPNIQRIPGTGRIQIELPGVENPERVRKLLQGVAKLEFWEVAEPNEVYPVLLSINQYLTEQAEVEESNLMDALTDSTENSTENDAADTPDGLSALVDDQEETLTDTQEQDGTATLDTAADEPSLASQLGATEGDSSALDSLQGPRVRDFLTLLQAQSVSPLYYRVTDTARINTLLHDPEISTLIPRNLKFLWSAKPTNTEATTEVEIFELYPVRVVRNQPAMSGDIISDARQDFDQNGAPEVRMVMNVTGAKKWKQITAVAASKEPKERIAIVLDDNVWSAPRVNEEIPNGVSSISGNFTLAEAQDLASVLQAGALPARTRIVEEAVVGPTLGKVAQQQGIQSMIAGLLIVIGFMIFYYARGGLVAIVALLFNIFFILGILAQLNAALTLPGIAGIVLTIGMSIDANVLIFERIREELRNGNTLKAAISNGYNKAYSSIVDANVTTLLTAIILYVLGQGPIKGFAITLMIGIFCSFFAAVFITRVIVDAMSRKGEESKLNFSTSFSKGWLSTINVNFMRYRKLGYLISASVIALGIVLVIAQGGLNLGVDFKGGRSYVVEFTEPVSATEIRNNLSGELKDASSEVKTYGSTNVVKITTSYLVEDESEEADSTVKEDVIRALETSTGLSYVPLSEPLENENFTISGSSKVGATIADDIKDAAFEAGIIAIIAIFLYILIRFRKWQFSVGAIVALIHDSAMVFTFFALARLFGVSYEIDQVFVAAILTIIGYSINDTVVVFDRIRETLGLKPGNEMTGLYNESINNTLNRTLI